MRLACCCSQQAKAERVFLWWTNLPLLIFVFNNYLLLVQAGNATQQEKRIK